MLPPGLAFVSMSAKATALMESSTCSSYYFDLKKYKKLAAKPDTPFTPAIGLVVALTESLRLVKERGLKETFAHFERLAQATRAAALALGLSLLPDDSCISNVLTAINVPEGVDGGKLVKLMRDTYGISIAGGQGALKGKIIRIAHMGCLDEYDIITGISCLEKALKELGYSFPLGKGVAAAQEYLNSK
jgi:aspartate aminotransferase-like enzyme